MKLFLDTADIDEIRTVASWGVLDGVTTNPTLYAKVGGTSYDSILQEICKLTPGPVSAEVVADEVDGMLDEGPSFRQARADNIVVKVPMSRERAGGDEPLQGRGHQDQLHPDLHANQGLLAAKAGASLLSPFVGRLDDINEEG